MATWTGLTDECLWRQLNNTRASNRTCCRPRTGTEPTRHPGAWTDSEWSAYMTYSEASGEHSIRRPKNTMKPSDGGHLPKELYLAGFNMDCLINTNKWKLFCSAAGAILSFDRLINRGEVQPEQSWSTVALEMATAINEISKYIWSRRPILCTQKSHLQIYALFSLSFCTRFISLEQHNSSNCMKTFHDLPKKLLFNEVD